MMRSDQVDEPIEIQQYDPGWIEVYRSEALRIRSHHGIPSIAIEHIGSTAIPGLCGKPVVDIMVGVRLSDLPAETLCLAFNGYEFPGKAGVPGRLYFRKRGKEAVNVHVVDYQEKHWTDILLLRDYLLVHADEAERYGRTKVQIVSRGISTLPAYSEAKREIVEELLAKARAWRIRCATESGIT
jgi:GrpB-like predicted nucleotidyltransferase (UPF0157 family)